MNRSFLVVAFLSACGVPRPSNEEVAAPPMADAAAEQAVTEWNDMIGSTAEPGDLPLVRWFLGSCLDYGDGDCVPGALVSSPLGGEEIHIIVRSHFHKTSLAHEVLHWILEGEGRPDPEHDSDDWAFVFNVNIALRFAGF